VNQNKILASFFLTLKWAWKKKKKKVNGPMGLVDSLETPNSKDYKNPSYKILQTSQQNMIKKQKPFLPKINK
jgi:hypothetical protein